MIRSRSSNYAYYIASIQNNKITSQYLSKMFINRIHNRLHDRGLCSVVTLCSLAASFCQRRNICGYGTVAVLILQMTAVVVFDVALVVGLQSGHYKMRLWCSCRSCSLLCGCGLDMQNDYSCGAVVVTVLQFWHSCGKNVHNHTDLQLFYTLIKFYMQCMQCGCGAVAVRLQCSCSVV